ncbi:MAG: hypothetical protein LUE88_03225 [Clostridiales bacterium]|nr:hypothetical protein [Clostridiales bacterium]
MEYYAEYKKGRDLAWQALIKSGTSSLPVNLKTVADSYGITVISFKKAEEDGIMPQNKSKRKVLVRNIKGRTTVFVNSKGLGKGETRFLIAKGIGLCLIAKKPWIPTRYESYAAKVFARDLLMPATVLFSIGAESPSDIAVICETALEDAETRAVRMSELRERNKFNQHPLEQQTKEQFKKFIEERA